MVAQNGRRCRAPCSPDTLVQSPFAPANSPQVLFWEMTRRHGASGWAVPFSWAPKPVSALGNYWTMAT